MRELGLVSQVFDEQQPQALSGDMAIGHVRYSTTGGGHGRTPSPSGGTMAASLPSPTTAT